MHLRSPFLSVGHIGALAGALTVAGCGASTGLDLNLQLDDAVHAAAATARIVVSRDDNGSFPTAPPSTIKPGLVVRNADVAGSGRVDIVVEFTRGYPLLAGGNHFRLVPSSVSQAINVRIRAEVYDAYGNLLAQLADAQGRDYVAAVLTPGQLTGQDAGGIVLRPACRGTCTAATVHPDPMHIVPVVPAIAGPLSALAAGNLTGSLKHRSDIAVGSGEEGSPAAPAEGHVRAYLGPVINAQGAFKDIRGASAGDQLGSALAIGDLDGDGKDDLVIGARGAALGSGALFVVFGTSSWWQDSTKAFDLGAANVKRFTASAPGARLGSAVALLDVNGDGKPEIIAGAPGENSESGAVYVVRASDLMGGAPDGGAAAPAITGRPGSQLGRSLAAYAGMLAIGAPLDTAKGGTVAGAVYLVAASDLASKRDAGTLGRWLGGGGGFASSVALARLDGVNLSLVAGAPAASTVTILTGQSSLAGDVTDVTHTVHGPAPVGSLGAALARAPLGTGDALILGAPALLPMAAGSPDGGAGDDAGLAADMAVPANTNDPSAGALFVFRGATLLLGNLNVAADGAPAAIAAFGDSAGSSYGSHLVVGDFNEDGVLDLAVGAAGKRSLYVLLGVL